MSEALLSAFSSNNSTTSSENYGFALLLVFSGQTKSLSINSNFKSAILINITYEYDGVAIAGSQFWYNYHNMSTKPLFVDIQNNPSVTFYPACALFQNSALQSSFTHDFTIEISSGRLRVTGKSISITDQHQFGFHFLLLSSNVALYSAT